MVALISKRWKAPSKLPFPKLMYFRSTTERRAIKLLSSSLFFFLSSSYRWKFYFKSNDPVSVVNFYRALSSWICKKLLISWLKFRNEVKNFRPTFHQLGKNDSFQNVKTLLSTEAGLYGSRKPRSENTSRPRFLLFINPSGRWESIFDSVYEPVIVTYTRLYTLEWLRVLNRGDTRACSRGLACRNGTTMSNYKAYVFPRENEASVCYGGLPSTMLINYLWYDRF